MIVYVPPMPITLNNLKDRTGTATAQLNGRCCKTFGTRRNIVFMSAGQLGFLGAFEKLQTATISFVMAAYPSVQPSVRMELASHLTDLHMSYYIFLKNLPRGFNSH
jgi:hypothetical protein